MSKLKIAILGSGNIGTDLLVKVIRSPTLECSLFAGRRESSPGIARAIALGVKTSLDGVNALLQTADDFDLVFDATDAVAHEKHWSLLHPLGKLVVDLTPSSIGTMCVPSLNMSEALQHLNLNLISCGGQASVPIASCVSKVYGEDLEYIEVVSSISSNSAGASTRYNLDEYVHNTEAGLRKFTGCKQVKAILILNPAKPCIDMQTTIFAKVPQANLAEITREIESMVARVAQYVPGYRLLVAPIFEHGRLVTTIKVKGLGDYLPTYAGNLDITTCAAIATAEAYARNRCESPATIGTISG